ncbi:MAG: polysaccharide biosynthesis tyrosine autokinase [Synechococcales cyanobacterium CRU_2_2]|nr:polysaccharide biosynthesis tyrosine autokinase [Synechococcales cyanobacterium CRU_2_2]
MTTDNHEGIDLDVKGYLSAIRRRRALGLLVFGLTLGAFGCMAPLLPRQYTAEGKLVFHRIDKITSLTGVGAGAGQLESLLANQTPLGTEKTILTSHTFLQDIIGRVGIKTPKGELVKVKDFRKHLNVEILGPTDVIQVSYKARDATLAIETVDTIMNQYLQDAVQKQQSETIAARLFVASQLPTVEKKLLNAEANLQQFKEKNGIVDLSQEAQLLTQSLEGLDQRMVNISADLNGVSQQAAQLQNNFQLSFGQTMAINILSQAPEVRGALDELAVVERELAEAQKVFQPSHPRVLAVKDKRAMLENTLNSQLEQALGTPVNIPKGLLESRGPRGNLLEPYIALEGERIKLSQQFFTLNQARSNYSNRARLIPQLQTSQEQLQRNVDVARTTYQALLQKFQEVQIAENQLTRNAEIVQPAILPDKGKTGRMLFLAAGTLLGLLFSSLAILIAELRDNSLKTLSEIKGSFCYPLLGVIPTIDNRLKTSQHESEIREFELFLANNGASFINEAYWMIQENIRFLNAQRQLKVIVVTSSVPAEGKSLVSANLATTMARQGRRVLLIDADLRDPIQHHLWKLNGVKGLSNVLQGQTQFRPERIPGVENLRILAAGEAVLNPLNLLASQTMFSLVRSATHYFDHIIIDAPPLLQAADALALGRLSDGILLVTRPGVIDRHSTTKAKEILQKHEQNILGLVVNGINRGYFPNSQHRSPGAISREVEVSIL